MTITVTLRDRGLFFHFFAFCIFLLSSWTTGQQKETRIKSETQSTPIRIVIDFFLVTLLVTVCSVFLGYLGLAS